MPYWERSTEAWLGIRVEAATPEDAAYQLLTADPILAFSAYLRAHPDCPVTITEAGGEEDYFEDCADTAHGGHIAIGYLTAEDILDVITGR